MLLVMIVLLGIGCIAMAVTVREAKKETNEYSRSTLLHVQRGIVRELDNIRQFAISLALDNDLRNYTYNLNSSASVAGLQELARKTTVGEGVREFAGSIYIYMESENIVILDGAKYDMQQFYDSEIAPTGESMRDWQERLAKKYYNKYNYSIDGGRKRLEYIQSYPVTGKNKGNIVISIDPDRLTEYFGTVYKSGRSLYVLDADGTVIFSVGEENYPLLPKYITMKDGSYSKWFSSVTALKSSSGEYSFIGIENSGAVSSGLKKIIVYNVLCIVLFIIIGVLCSMLAAYKMSKLTVGIKSVLGRLYGVEGSEELGIDDINRRLSAIVEESKTADEIMDEQRGMIKNNLLKRLISGNPGDIGDVTAELEKVGVSFDMPGFLAVTAEISFHTAYDSKTIALAKYAVTKMTSELFEDICHIEIIDDDWKDVAMILNFEPGEKVYDKILGGLRSVDDFMSKELKIDTEINVGDVYNDVKELYRSYQEAKECSEYRIYSGTGRVLAYGKIKNKENGYFYSAEQENEFIRNVIMGNEKAALACLDSIISAHKNCSVAALRCFFFNLLGTMLKFLNSGNLEVAKEIDSYCRYDELFGCKGLDELQAAIRSTVQEICRDINLHGKNKKQNLKRAMLEYIENNYCDNAMSLEQLADEFNLNLTYVSHFFKEQIGENFSDYITGRRIEKAKELLRSTDLTVSEIAIKVGYANSAGLIKNFKKIENSTPGKYRETN